MDIDVYAPKVDCNRVFLNFIRDSGKSFGYDFPGCTKFFTWLESSYSIVRIKNEYLDMAINYLQIKSISFNCDISNYDALAPISFDIDNLKLVIKCSEFGNSVYKFDRKDTMNYQVKRLFNFLNMQSVHYLIPEIFTIYTAHGTLPILITAYLKKEFIKNQEMYRELMERYALL